MGAEGTSSPAPAAGWVTLADGQPGERAQALPTPGRTLAQLVIAALIVLGLVLVGTSFAASRLAEREAVNDAAHTANLLAQAVIQPALTDALVAGDPAAFAAFDRVVRDSVLPNNIVRVKLWHPDGTIVYADETRLVGQKFTLDPEQLEVLTVPQTRAEVSELDRSENEFERYGGKLLEVYRPVWTPGGEALLFEVYGAYAPVAERTSDLWRGLAGLIASSLLLLFVLMTPILWKVLDRLGQAHAHREDLLPARLSWLELPNKPARPATPSSPTTSEKPAERFERASPACARCWSTCIRTGSPTRDWPPPWTTSGVRCARVAPR